MGRHSICKRHWPEPQKRSMLQLLRQSHASRSPSGRATLIFMIYNNRRGQATRLEGIIRMKVQVFLSAATGLQLLVGPAFAHHSFAMFDPEKLITQPGVVKEFEWTNPHVWLHVVAPDSTGKPVEWSFEMQATAQASSGGWRPDSVKPGDKVTVEFHPLK